jgi:HSP20 family protein
MWNRTWQDSFLDYSDLGATLDRTALDTFRQRFDRLFQGLDAGREFLATTDAFDEPRFFFKDDGDRFVIRGVLPGVPASTLELTLTGQSLKLRAKRAVEVPEGYAAHRRERNAFDLARSFSLPARVDAERVTAESKDGIVTISLPKAQEAKPRSITVKAQ